MTSNLYKMRRRPEAGGEHRAPFRLMGSNSAGTVAGQKAMRQVTMLAMTNTTHLHKAAKVPGVLPSEVSGLLGQTNQHL